MKRLFLAVCCFAAAGLVHAAPAQKTDATPPDRPEFAPPLRFSLNPEDYEDSALAGRMIAARQKVLDDINARRAELLQSNPTAKKLREQILELNQKLAATVASDSEMIRMNSRLSDLNVKIDRLERAKKKEPAQEQVGSSAQ